ncbi:hypothetical protein RHSIM_Rhsim04G0187500 [Rhododendron simsii]|uniref:Non-haem dioxygenase N-terminal domain-containing protein n=1 Tax=Rhododendron simsii TaxID=118357 RepID=A0A834HCK9_RHOSS|nr:hypothetical protein RHSIM_Rhsim04G0187500 [Rhododendron simsii]
MVVTSIGEEDQAQNTPEYDRKSELKAFDDSKTGVKGLVDAGVTKIPLIFIHEKSQLDDISTTGSIASKFSVPVIDLEGIHGGPAQRTKIIEKIRDACEKWGFFQVVNHGIPLFVMADMIDGVWRFHKQDTEVKKGFYSRDVIRKFIYNSNFDLYQAPAANWRDTISCVMAPQPPDPQELPAVCRYNEFGIDGGLAAKSLAPKFEVFSMKSEGAAFNEIGFLDQKRQGNRDNHALKSTKHGSGYLPARFENTTVVTSLTTPPCTCNYESRLKLVALPYSPAHDVLLPKPVLIGGIQTYIAVKIVVP